MANKKNQPKLIKSEQIGKHLSMPLFDPDDPVLLDLRTNPIHECRVYDKHGKLIRTHTREELIERARKRARAINLSRLKEMDDE